MINLMKILKFLGILVILGALIGGLVLVQKRQETRRGAYFGTITAQLLPDQQSVTVGQQFVSIFKLNMGNYKLTGFDVLTRYDKSKLRVISVGVGFSTANLTWSDPVVDANTGTIRAQMIIMGSGESNLPTGVVDGFKINFEAITAGAAEVSVGTSQTIVTAYHSGAGDSDLSIGGNVRAVYTVTERGGPTNTLPPGTARLNFRMTFDGVKPDAGCANWKVRALVLTADGNKRDYGLIDLSKDSTVKINRGEDEEEYQVYRGSVQLIGISQRNGLALFLKGPKHLQIKYGINGQTEFYNRSGGELTVSEGEDSPVYNFSLYPMLAGDIVGEGDEPDGRVDGRDFAYVKAESVTRKTVDAGHDMKADLDGNCVLISTDVTRLMMALTERQEQMY